MFPAETVSEKFLADHPGWKVYGGVKPLTLARWPLISVTSVTEDSTLLVVGTDYLVDYDNGQLTRLDTSGFPCSWHPLPLTVVYVAGFSVTPADVEDAIIRMVTKRHSAKGRDPALKQESIPGVIEQSWWVATGSEAGNMTPDITDVLDNYRMPVSA